MITAWRVVYRSFFLISRGTMQNFWFVVLIFIKTDVQNCWVSLKLSENPRGKTQKASVSSVGSTLLLSRSNPKTWHVSFLSQSAAASTFKALFLSLLSSRRQVSRLQPSVTLCLFCGIIKASAVAWRLHLGTASPPPPVSRLRGKFTRWSKVLYVPGCSPRWPASCLQAKVGLLCTAKSFNTPFSFVFIHSISWLKKIIVCCWVKSGKIVCDTLWIFLYLSMPFHTCVSFFYFLLFFLF